MSVQELDLFWKSFTKDQNLGCNFLLQLSLEQLDLWTLQTFRFSEMKVCSDSCIGFGLSEENRLAFLCHTLQVVKAILGLFPWVLMNVNTERNTMNKALKAYSHNPPPCLPQKLGNLSFSPVALLVEKWFVCFWLFFKMIWQMFYLHNRLVNSLETNCFS